MAASADTAELLLRPATELAALVRGGEISARELTEAALGRIEALDGDVGAFTLVDPEGALAVADSIGARDERPFAGVPTAIKDLFAPVAGQVMSGGSDSYGDYTPDYDNYVVRRIKDAGFVPVGKTSTPEFGIPSITEPRRFGPTRNPWDLERTPGGSSGGASAAVAAGMIPVAHGSDGGGSIRIPAACTGLVGLKPARGRVSLGPEIGGSMLVQNGMLCRTVTDAAATLDVLAGYEPGDAYWAPPPAAPFAEAVEREPGRLRVLVTADPPISTEVATAHLRALDDATELLASLGHEVERVDAPWKDTDLLPVFSRMWAALASVGVVHAASVTGREPSAEYVESVTWWLWESAQALTATDFLLAEAQLQAISRAYIQELWSRCDVLMLPVLARRPVRVGEIDMDGEDPAAEFAKTGQFTPFTATFNLSGQPAISLPLYHGEDGLPVAVQLVGRPAGEEQLLSLSGQIERAAPWADRVSSLAVA